jgi:ABC-type transport system involved in cytochrome bd biosynthesis fused ATPase/permease subunit
MRGARHVRLLLSQNISESLTACSCSKASVILADEAAAHVDDETERKISAALLRAACQGRTVLSVAHR